MLVGLLYDTWTSVNLIFIAWPSGTAVEPEVKRNIGNKSPCGNTDPVINVNVLLRLFLSTTDGKIFEQGASIPPFTSGSDNITQY